MPKGFEEPKVAPPGALALLVVTPYEDQRSRLEHGRRGFEEVRVPGVHSQARAVEGTALAVATTLGTFLLPVDVIPELDDQIGLPFRHPLRHLGERPVVGIAAVLEAVVERAPGLHAAAGVADHGYAPRVW